MLKLLGLIAAIAVALAGAPVAAAHDHHDTRSPSVERRIDGLLSKMTLEEKVQELYGVGRPRGVHSVGYVPGVPRLGIPPLLQSDGPVGVKDSCFGEILPDNCFLGQSTAFPATSSLAASFDPDLAREYGRVLGAESRARGVDVLYGPAMNIVRVPQGGRNFEYFSEDPYLTGRLASAYVQGLQSRDVAAQIKHFALNNQERDRHESTSNADERTMREIYLPAWQRAVDAGADSVMCANNKVNGTYNCENAPLLREILEGEWGFQGVVGSDYAATNSALGSINGGLDQSFTGRDWGKWYDQLPELVRSGQVSESLIDEHVRRVLRMMFRLHMLGDGHRDAGRVDVTGDGALSRKVAEQGAVLLKNDREQLPLDASALHSVAVIGQHADAAMTGGGGSSKVDPYYSVSPAQGIRDRVGDGVAVTTADGRDLAQAADLARSSDVAVVIVNDTEREGADRTSIALPGTQDQLVEAVQAANPNTVVVLDTGSSVTMPWIADVHALLEMWYPGEEDGNALAALLFGDVDPAGRLPVTFPASLAQDCCHTPPRYPDANGVYEYSEGLQVGYRWYDAQGLEPLFPFGYGLSYTSFAYRDLEVAHEGAGARGLRVSLRVTNTGRRPGTATPQVYLGLPDGVGEPPRRLVATDKVRLEPGESRRVSFDVPRTALSYWSADAHNWAVAPGEYTVFAGASSRDLPLRRVLRVRDGAGEQGLRVAAPGSVSGGDTAEVTVTLTNTGRAPLTHPHVDLRAPHGWAVRGVGRRPHVVAPHGRASISYRVQVPRDAGPALWVLTAAARWGGPVAGSATRAVSITAG